MLVFLTVLFLPAPPKKWKQELFQTDFSHFTLNKRHKQKKPKSFNYLLLTSSLLTEQQSMGNCICMYFTSLPSLHNWHNSASLIEEITVHHGKCNSNMGLPNYNAQKGILKPNNSFQFTIKKSKHPFDECCPCHRFCSTLCGITDKCCSN